MCLFSFSLSLKRLLSLSLFRSQTLPFNEISLSLSFFFPSVAKTRALLSFSFARVRVCVRLTHAQLDVFPEVPRATSLSLSQTNARNQRAARKKFL